MAVKGSGLEAAGPEVPLEPAVEEQLEPAVEEAAPEPRRALEGPGNSILVGLDLGVNRALMGRKEACWVKGTERLVEWPSGGRAYGVRRAAPICGERESHAMGQP